MKIFVSAGDPSGDRNFAPIVRSIFETFPNVICAGLGGPAMQREGFTSFFEFYRFNKMGYTEVLSDLKFFLDAKKEFIAKLKDEKPDLLICVDYSGFNTPLMKAAAELSIPVVWFIAPMIWAWKKYKHGPRLAKYASHIATILPFEVRYWQEFTQNVTYVGNPLLEEKQLHKTIERENLTNKEEIVVAIAPGSRKMELQRVLPTIIKTILKLQEDTRRNFKFRVSVTEYLPKNLYNDIEQAGAELYTGNLTTLFQNADLAIVTSGTTTLHAALTNLPMVIIYKSSFILYSMVKILTKQSEFSHIGLPNIMVEPDEAAKELIQFELTTKNLVSEISKLITDKNYYQNKITVMSNLRNSFGNKQPSIELIKIIKNLTNND